MADELKIVIRLYRSLLDLVIFFGYVTYSEHSLFSIAACLAQGTLHATYASFKAYPMTLFCTFLACSRNLLPCSRHTSCTSLIASCSDLNLKLSCPFVHPSFSSSVQAMESTMRLSKSSSTQGNLTLTPTFVIVEKYKLLWMGNTQ